MGTRADTRKVISMFNTYRLGEHTLTMSLADRAGAHQQSSAPVPVETGPLKLNCTSAV